MIRFSMVAVGAALILGLAADAAAHAIRSGDSSAALSARGDLAGERRALRSLQEAAQVAARAVLTVEQQTVFDRNVAALREREQARRDRAPGRRGERRQGR